MGNSHPSGWKTRLVYRPFRDLDFDVKFWQEQREEAMRGGEARKKFGARRESGKITPATFARPGLPYQVGIAPRPIDVVTGRSGMRCSDAWSDRVRGSLFGIRFPSIGLIERVANRPAIGGIRDVEQWKQIPRKAESGAHAFL